MEEKGNGLSQLVHDKNQKILLLNTPNYGNVGDSAITLGEMELLKDNFPSHSIYEFSNIDIIFHLKKIEKYTAENDVVIINGGGSIGSLWPLEHNRIMKILQTFKNHKIVIGPQTIYFKKSDEGLLNDFIETIKGCKDLTILVREQNSFNFLESLNVPCKYQLVPDAALYLKSKLLSPQRNDKVLLCLRKDHEKISGNNLIINLLKKLRIKFDITNTVVPQVVTKQGRKKFVQKKIDQFSHYKMLITDRLHGMVLSALASTPCLAFDNLSKKVSGVNKWMGHLDYVTCVDKSEFSDELFQKIYNSSANCQFDNKPLANDVKKIVDAIKN